MSDEFVGSETLLQMDPTVVAGLTWGLKRSFLGYLARTPMSQVSLGSGAGVTTQSEFWFPLADASQFDVQRGDGVLKFSGNVRFIGHGGFLHVLLDRPWIEVTADSALLSFTECRTEDPTDQRMGVASLTWPTPQDDQGDWIWPEVPTALASAGVELFNDVYPVGEALEPIRLRIPQ
ncbi:HtaA domain-containing protein [Salinibacterium sp. ZJ454]|uniref:HtaA domain-containing protein n=1 Tax=Salinibacterium sp. ZJ454 TaxID=2708339 RepID=UPI00141FF9CD|nr:HtaA domain-containing protein [Salinibacterium sp. ZJ454]